MRRALSIALALFALVPLSLAAQAEQPVLRLRPLEGPSLDESELAAIQNLVTSAIVELKAFRVLDLGGQELALAEAETALALGRSTKIDPLAADYLIGGSILPAGGLLVFSLESTRVSSGEKRSVSETLSDRGELILAARRLARRLLDREGLPELGSGPEPGSGTGGQPAGYPGPTAGAPGTAAGAPGTPPPALSDAGSPRNSAVAPSIALPEATRQPSLSALAGSWLGDKGVDRVKLYPDGRGIAFLSSGASMRIKASVSGERIVVVQAQANLPEFYRSGAIDFETARTISRQARPWKWIFALSLDGKTLFGVKESVFVSRDEKGKLAIDNDYTRNALWLRTER